MDKKELKKLDAAALNNEITSLRKELFNLRLSQLTGQVKDVSQFRKLKKQIAQAKTFLTQTHKQNNKV
jgi:large subunit ribosomal protein L29